VLGWVLVFSACSGGGPSAPQEGSPEWLWLAAEENFAVGDYAKTDEHLKELADAESEWQKRAVTWRIVLLSGLSRSYRSLGDAYSKGAEESPAQVSDFSNGIQQNQRDARQYGIELAEALPKYLKILGSDGNVTLDFAFPAGSPNESALAKRIEGGDVIPDAQQAEATEQEVKRGVLLQATLFAGTGEDVNAARTKFGAGSVEVPRTVFMNALGRTMWIVSEVFDRTHLNQPDIEKIFVTHATKSIETALASDNEELKEQAEELKEEMEEKQKLDERIRKGQR
jgi:hypothetical protein